jgi:hypothetical protein
LTIGLKAAFSAALNRLNIYAYNKYLTAIVMTIDIHIIFMENDMANVRTIITLSQEDQRWLESYRNLHDISVAEAIRQGIRKSKEMALYENYQALVKNSKNLWKKGNGLDYQKKIRSECNS